MFLLRQQLVIASLALLAQTILGSATCHAETTPAALKQHEQRVRRAVGEVLPCVVCIKGRGGSGSGVVVSADGLILTVAHGTRKVGKNFAVVFPDGRQVRGKSLGLYPGRDAAMLQITEQGEYPFVELGTSAKLKKGDWCFALGHPGGFHRDPPLRLGRVLNIGTYIQTSCTTAVGDSGGPMFDLDGHLIGIHSNIGRALTSNCHAPIDVYRDNWDRIKKGELLTRPTDDAAPPRKNYPRTDAHAAEDRTWLKQQLVDYESVVNAASKSTYSVFAGKHQIALATAVTDRTLLTATGKIGSEPFVIEVGPNRRVAGTVVKRFEDYDLALIRVSDAEQESVAFRPVEFTAADVSMPLGTFVVAVGPTAEPEAAGVISVDPRRSKVPVSRRRNKQRPKHSSALQHDCSISNSACGGPLVNLDGQVIGVNIGRTGRYSSYAIPAGEIQRLLKTVP